MENLKVGDRIYYTGDMANGSSFGVISKITPPGRFQAVIHIILDEPRFEGDDCTTNVPPLSFEPGPGRRFMLASEYHENQRRAIEQMTSKLAG